MKINVVLLEPEIPQNTGNIARTCAATGASLHLIHPLGFSVEDKYVRRAGLDYWNMLDIFHYDNWDDFSSKNTGRKASRADFWFATTKARLNYTQPSYGDDVYFIFGPESRGIPEELLLEYRGKNVRIPMMADARSLNLSNSAALFVYEGLRQNGFAGLCEEGHLHRLKEPK